MALTDNLVSYWKLDETSGNASDSTANVKTLTNVGTVTYAAAKINNGADFGTANTTMYLTRTGYVVPDGACSFSFWVKQRTEIASGTQTYILSGSESTSFRLDYDYNAGSRRLQLTRVRNNLTNVTTNYTVTLGTAAFYHVVGVYDASTITLYVNGVNVSSTAATLNGTTNWSPGGGYFSIGALRDSNDGTISQYASAYIDEVAMYSRGITSTEAMNLYNSGFANAYPFTGYLMTAVVGAFTIAAQSVNMFRGFLTNTAKPVTTIINSPKT